MGEKTVEERLTALEYQQLSDLKDIHEMKVEINNVKTNQESFHIQIKSMFDSIMAQIAEIKKWQFEKDAVTAYREKQEQASNNKKSLWFPLLTEWVKILTPVALLLVALAATGVVGA